ncbi:MULTISPECIES: hypothetical protein [Chloroflexus]|uniref:hypothetical protein n=1 Tax=Chloroflexus TaxID=1107 RepID=UPI00031DE0BC|nr:MULTISPECIES: hypothetical protein [Chloroflexus]
MISITPLLSFMRRPRLQAHYSCLLDPRKWRARRIKPEANNGHRSENEHTTPELSATYR